MPVAEDYSATFAALAAEAREAIEGRATAVREMRTAYLDIRGGRRYAVTVANDRVKVEGMPVRGMVSPDEAPSLLKPFVDCCLSFCTGDTLVWRRLPAVEEDGGKTKITARLLWLGSWETPDADGHGFTDG